MINLMYARFFKAVLLPCLLISFSNSCQSQQHPGRTSDEELLKKELQHQEKALHGNKHAHVEIITDPAKVARIRNEISIKIKKKQEQLNAEKFTSSLPDRYRAKDPAAIPAMINILSGSDINKKKELYDGLEKKYDDPENFTIQEPALAAAILDGIDDPATEADVVQLAGRDSIAGYVARMESRLLSGKSNNTGRIFFWLSQEGSSLKSLNYADAATREGRIRGEDLDDVISGLDGFAEKNDAAIKKQVGDLALYIYQQQLIAAKRFEDLKNMVYTSDAAEGLLNCIFKYGDERAIPVANDILNRKIRIDGPVKALIRLEGNKHLDKVYQYLRDPEKFYDGLDLVETIDRKLVTDEMLKEVLKQFSRMDHGDKIATDRIVSSFIKLGAAQYLAAAGNYINNRQLAAVVKSRYEISKISTDSMLNDLLRYKLISEKPSASVVTLIMKAEEGSQSGFIMGLLTRESRWLNFDTETDFLPVDYDQLLMNYAAKSKGMLKDMLVWMDNRKKKNGNQYDYTITVVCNNKAFIARPQDSGDWYDMMTVNELLDKVLIDLNSRERFVQLDHWGQDLDIIYGEPAPVNELVKKYGL